MPFCPTCELEYRPGVERCPDCGGELVDQPPERAALPQGEVEEVLLCCVRGEIHARLLIDALRSRDIPSRTQLGGIADSPWYLAAMPAGVGASEDVTIRIYVRREDLDRARQVYEDMETIVAEDPLGDDSADDESGDPTR
jgi:hypothetical protein